MATSTYLVSAAVMGALAVGVFVLAAGLDWRRYRVPREDGGGWLDWAATDVSAWLVGFVVLTVAAVAGLVVVLQSGSGALFVGGLGIVFAGFLAFAVYVTGKSRGHPHSHAVGEALVALGAAGLIAVVAWLLLTAGA